MLCGVLARNGHEVQGYDPSTEAIKALRSGTPLTYEPGLSGLLEENHQRLRFTSNPTEALANARLVFIIVPTPSLEDGSFDNSYVNSALDVIGKHIAAHDGFLTIVVSSTVSPESCQKEFIPRLEATSGKSVNTGFALVYSPWFIALGSVISNMARPDLILIGESTPNAGEEALDVILSMVDNQPEVERMSLSSAEVAKIAVNTFVTTKISFANMLSEVCEGLPGSNVDDVTKALGADSRIGSSYLRAGLGYGGPCFPRDNKAMVAFSRSVGVSADIAVATDSVNGRQVARVVQAVVSRSSPGDLVAIIGLSYKENTSVTEKSQGLEIALDLGKRDRRILVYDPLIDEDQLNSPLRLARDWVDFNEAKVVVFTHPGITVPEQFQREFSGVVLDLWGVPERNGLRVFRPGRG